MPQMVKTDTQGKKMLRHLGDCVLSALATLPLRGPIRLRGRKGLNAHRTSSDGWRIRLGHIGKSLNIEFRWDHYAAHDQRLLWCGVFAKKKAMIQELAKILAKEIEKPLTLGDSDWTVRDHHSQLKKTLPRSALGGWVVEIHDNQPFPYFLGTYFDEKTTQAAFSPDADITPIISLLFRLAELQPRSKTDLVARERCEQASLHQRLEHSRRCQRIATERKQRDNFRCNACGIRFVELYGPLGFQFAECHHRVPLAKLDAGTVTKLSDLITVCANCHRMLHRMNGERDDIVRLKQILRKKPMHAELSR